MNPKWYDFELFSVQWHRDQYPTDIVWHQSVVPEDQLCAAGFINDFNRHRLGRIARAREGKGNPLLYSDYGMDFLIKREDKYYAGQAKHYTKKRVTSSDIGSTLALMYRGFHGIYLYTTSKLEVNLRETVQMSQGTIVHHQLQFTEYTAQENKQVTETEVVLRHYQEEAITSGASCLHLFTSAGKTLCAGYILRNKNKRVIIVSAPLVVSVEQFKRHLKPFLPGHEGILVDCEGTTDADYLKDKLKDKTKSYAIFSTFTSTVNVLAKVFENIEEDMMLAVDEVHNAIGKEDLCSFINRFSDEQRLLLSATIPEELYDIFDVPINKRYKFTIGQAIKEGYCTDYDIFLPYIELETSTINVDIPDYLSHLDNTQCAQALFLAKGMLSQGKRRCIAYMRSQEECHSFASVLRETFDKFHGLTIWTAVVVSGVAKKERRNILKQFENGSDDVIHIILSVRILDEAVNVVRCDSQFISHVGDAANDIRTVQRLGRGLRLDKKNPSKRNAMFMWCNEWSQAVTSLSLLKENDPEFHKKVQIIDSDYDKEKTTRQIVGNQKRDIAKFINVHCMTPDELWEVRRQQWIEQYQKLGHAPRHHVSDPEEKRAGIFQKTMRQNYKQGKLSQERIDKLNQIEEWHWDGDKFNENFCHWIFQYRRLGHIPRTSGKDLAQNKAARWQFMIRQMFNNNKLTRDRVDTLNQNPNWTWQIKDQFDENLEHWMSQYQRLQRSPHYHSTDIQEKKAGQWQSMIRKWYKEGTLSRERIDTLNHTENWEWEKKDPFNENLQHWIHQYQRLGHTPRYGSDNPEEKRAGRWQSYMRQQHKNGKLSQDRIDKLNETEGWRWSS